MATVAKEMAHEGCVCVGSGQGQGDELREGGERERGERDRGKDRGMEGGATAHEHSDHIRASWRTCQLC